MVGTALCAFAYSLLDVGIGMPRNADRAIRANRDHIQRWLDAAAIDELRDELGEALLAVGRHAVIVADLQGCLDHRTIR